MSKTLRWWLFFCLSIGMFALAYVFGLIEELYNKDVTKISFGIIALYIFGSLLVGKTSIDMNKGKDVKAPKEIAWFMSESMLALGMIGTVAGFILMLGSSFEGLDVADTESLKETLTAMAIGMSTALYTTLTGLVCSQLLKVQLVNIEAGE